VRRPYPGITGYDGQEPKPPASFLTGGFFPEMIFPETMHRTSRILALTALLFAAGGLPGVLLGSLAVSHMNSNIPGKIFGGFLLLMGIKELFRKGD